jgi:hypothetical protein
MGSEVIPPETTMADLAAWRTELKHDPVASLLFSGNEAIILRTKRELLEETSVPPETMWKLASALRLLRRQQPNGSWKYRRRQGRVRLAEDYDQIETYRVLRELVEKYRLTNQHGSVKRAAEFVLSRQTDAGDIRGIYGSQYTPNYTAGLLELLIKAGYEDDWRVEKCFRWLLEYRQDDGAWAIPLRTVGAKFTHKLMMTRTIEPMRSKPSSWFVTGVVLRAFAAHPKYRTSPEARRAGEFLKSMIFKKDNYRDRGSPNYWISFTYPFWFTDLLSAMDSLSLLGFQKDDPQIVSGLAWFINNQKKDGTWGLRQLRSGGDTDVQLWSALAICSVLKRFYG